MAQTIPGDLNKSALRGEPSHVWRAGQERRLDMILKAAEQRLGGRVLVDGQLASEADLLFMLSEVKSS